MTKSNEYYVKMAKKHGLEIKEGGSHTKIVGPAGRGYMAIPRHTTLSKGVECNVRKWFRLLGIIVMFAVIVAIAI